MGYLDFKQLVLTLGIISSNRVTEKLKLLYVLHLPPLLSRAEIEAKADDKSTTPTNSTVASGAVKGDSHEMATEAEDFFSEDVSESLEALPSPSDHTFPVDITSSRPFPIDRHASVQPVTPTLSVSSAVRQSIFYVDLPASDQMSHGSFGAVDSCSDISDLGKVGNFDGLSEYSEFSDLNVAAGGTSTDSNLDGLRTFFDHPDSNFTQKSIPMMAQPNFEALWCSLMQILGHTNDLKIQRACKFAFFNDWFNFILFIFYLDDNLIELGGSRTVPSEEHVLHRKDSVDSFTVLPPTADCSDQVCAAMKIALLRIYSQ